MKKINIELTKFQQQVLKATLEIPFGETRSYKWLGERMRFDTQDLMLKKIGGSEYLNVLKFKMKEIIKKRKEKKYNIQEVEEMLELAAV